MFIFALAFLAPRLLDVAGSASGGAQSAQAASTPAQTSQGASSTSPDGSSQSGQGQQPQGQQQQTDPNASDPAYGNWKALRDQADSYKTRATQLEGQVTTFTQMQTNASNMAKALGYTAEDFAEAFKNDPIGTLSVLHQQTAQAKARGHQDGQQNGRGDLEAQIRQQVEAATKPVSEFVNTQMAEAAMVKYETNLGTAIQADPILSTAPPEVQELVKDYLGEYFASQPEILLGMKTKGDFSAVPDAVKYISGRLHTAFTKWLAAGNSPAGGQGQRGQDQQQGQAGKRPTLDEIIADPGVLGTKYAAN